MYFKEKHTELCMLDIHNVYLEFCGSSEFKTHDLMENFSKNSFSLMGKMIMSACIRFDN